MKNPALRITNICCFGNAILIRDSKHTLWVQGLNCHDKLTTDGSTIDYRPWCTGITLDRDEVYSEAYHKGNIFTIRTSKKRLFIAEVLDFEPTLDYDCTPNTVFRSTPFVDVDQVSYLGETVIFTRRDSIFVYNHRLLRGEIDAFVDENITIDPITINSQVICHKLRLAETLEKPNPLYMHHYIHFIYGKRKNLVMVPSSDPTKLVECIYFDQHPAYEHAGKRRGYLLENIPTFTMVFDDIACAYDPASKSLVKIECRGKAKVLNKRKKDSQCLVFIDGPTIYNPDGSVRCTVDPETCISNISHIAGPGFHMGTYPESSKTFVISGESLCFHKEKTRWCFPMKVGLVTFREGRLYLASVNNYDYHLLQKIKVVSTPKGLTYYVYRFNISKNMYSAFGSSDSMLTLQSETATLFRMELSETKPFANWIVDLDVSSDPVILEAIAYKQPTLHSNTITIDQCESSPLSILLNQIPSIPYPTAINVRSGEEDGEGITRVFLERAILEFQSVYLTKVGAHTVFNSQAVTGPDRNSTLYNLGIVLHLAITILQSYLPIRVPLAILAAIKNRDMSIEELKYFVRLTDPELLDRLGTQTDDILTYRAHLEAILQLDSPASKADAAIIAEGFSSYTELVNIDCMNIPTLDMYVSGTWEINRTIFKNMLDGSDDLVEAVDKVIDSATNEQITALLVNWSGTSALAWGQSYNIEASDQDGIYFDTDSRTLLMNQSCVNSTTDDLCRILTDPFWFETFHSTYDDEDR